MSRQRSGQRQQPLWVVILLMVVGLLFWYFERRPQGPTGSVTTSGACGDKFAFGRPEASAAGRTTFLCRNNYAVLHDNARKVPLYAAEHLIARDLARDVSRTDDFRPDPDLPPGERAEMNDYTRSGYSRGHMAPAADADTPLEMSQSFYLSNMVPQNQEMNAGIWSGLESATRACTKTSGELYVLTGPIFSGRSRSVGRSRVAVPDQIFKIALNAKSGQYRAFVMPNKALPRRTDFAPYEVSIAEVERKTGLNFFPQAKFNEGTRGNLCSDAYGS